MTFSDNGEEEWFEEKYGTNNPEKLRDMLCRTLENVEFQDPGVVLDDDVKEWFIKHKEWDKRRKELGLSDLDLEN